MTPGTSSRGDVAREVRTESRVMISLRSGATFSTKAPVPAKDENGNICEDCTEDGESSCICQSSWNVPNYSSILHHTHEDLDLRRRLAVKILEERQEPSKQLYPILSRYIGKISEEQCTEWNRHEYRPMPRRFAKPFPSEHHILRNRYEEIFRTQIRRIEERFYSTAFTDEETDREGRTLYPFIWKRKKFDQQCLKIEYAIGSKSLREQYDALRELYENMETYLDNYFYVALFIEVDKRLGIEYHKKRREDSKSFKTNPFDYEFQVKIDPHGEEIVHLTRALQFDISKQWFWLRSNTAAGHSSVVWMSLDAQQKKRAQILQELKESGRADPFNPLKKMPEPMSDEGNKVYEEFRPRLEEAMNTGAWRAEDLEKLLLEDYIAFKQAWNNKYRGLEWVSKTDNFERDYMVELNVLFSELALFLKLYSDKLLSERVELEYRKWATSQSTFGIKEQIWDLLEQPLPDGKVFAVISGELTIIDAEETPAKKVQAHMNDMPPALGGRQDYEENPSLSRYPRDHNSKRIYGNAILPYFDDLIEENYLRDNIPEEKPFREPEHAGRELPGIELEVEEQETEPLPSFLRSEHGRKQAQIRRYPDWRADKARWKEFVRLGKLRMNEDRKWQEKNACLVPVVCEKVNYLPEQAPSGSDAYKRQKTNAAAGPSGQFSRPNGDNDNEDDDSDSELSDVEHRLSGLPEKESVLQRRKRGRPKGSKNKATLAKEAEAAARRAGANQSTTSPAEALQLVAPKPQADKIEEQEENAALVPRAGFSAEAAPLPSNGGSGSDVKSDGRQCLYETGEPRFLIGRPSASRPGDGRTREQELIATARRKNQARDEATDSSVTPVETPQAGPALVSAHPPVSQINGQHSSTHHGVAAPRTINSLGEIESPEVEQRGSMLAPPPISADVLARLPRKYWENGHPTISGVYRWIDDRTIAGAIEALETLPQDPAPVQGHPQRTMHPSGQSIQGTQPLAQEYSQQTWSHNTNMMQASSYAFRGYHPGTTWSKQEVIGDDGFLRIKNMAHAPPQNQSQPQLGFAPQPMQHMQPAGCMHTYPPNTYVNNGYHIQQQFPPQQMQQMTPAGSMQNHGSNQYMNNGYYVQQPLPPQGYGIMGIQNNHSGYLQQHQTGFYQPPKGFNQQLQHVSTQQGAPGPSQLPPSQFTESPALALALNSQVSPPTNGPQTSPLMPTPTPTSSVPQPNATSSSPGSQEWLKDQISYHSNLHVRIMSLDEDTLQVPIANALGLPVASQPYENPFARPDMEKNAQELTGSSSTNADPQIASRYQPSQVPLAQQMTPVNSQERPGSLGSDPMQANQQFARGLQPSQIPFEEQMTSGNWRESPGSHGSSFINVNQPFAPGYQTSPTLFTQQMTPANSQERLSSSRSSFMSANQPFASIYRTNLLPSAQEMRPANSQQGSGGDFMNGSPQFARGPQPPQSPFSQQAVLGNSRLDYSSPPSSSSHGSSHRPQTPLLQRSLPRDMQQQHASSSTPSYQGHSYGPQPTFHKRSVSMSWHESYTLSPSPRPQEDSYGPQIPPSQPTVSRDSQDRHVPSPSPRPQEHSDGTQGMPLQPNVSRDAQDCNMPPPTPNLQGQSSSPTQRVSTLSRVAQASHQNPPATGSLGIPEQVPRAAENSLHPASFYELQRPTQPPRQQARPAVFAPSPAQVSPLKNNPFMGSAQPDIDIQGGLDNQIQNNAPIKEDEEPLQDRASAHPPTSPSTNNQRSRFRRPMRGYFSGQPRSDVESDPQHNPTRRSRQLANQQAVSNFAAIQKPRYFNTRQLLGLGCRRPSADALHPFCITDLGRNIKHFEQTRVEPEHPVYAPTGRPYNPPPEKALSMDDFIDGWDPADSFEAHWEKKAKAAQDQSAESLLTEDGFDQTLDEDAPNNSFFDAAIWYREE